MRRKGFYPDNIKKYGKDAIKVKTIIFLLVCLLCNMTTTTMAVTDDELYAKAFNTVTKCETDISQQNINLARDIIKDMSKSSALKFAVGEFSKKIDVAQQKLFDEFYSYMYENAINEKLFISQKDINEARKYLNDFATYKDNDIYVASWSSKLDEFQGKIIVKANNSVKDYQKLSTQENLMESSKWISELGSATNVDCRKEASRLKKIIDTCNGTNDILQLPIGMKSILQMEIQQEKEIYGKTLNNEDEMKIAIRGALRNFEEVLKVKVYNIKGINIGNMLNLVLESAPEIDYGYKGGSYSILDEDDGGQIITIKFKYAYEKSKLIEQREAVYRKVQEVISENIYAYMTKFEMELFFHDYLVENTEYNEYYINQGVNHPEDHSAYGTLIEKAGVCEGYAKAMCVLSKSAGLECLYVKGVANGAHGWNMVKLDDNKWYILDITWNDPVYRSEDSKVVKTSYKYFNIPQEEFKNDHATTSNVPKVDGTQYLRDNLQLNEKDIYGKDVINISNKAELMDALKKCIVNREAYMVGNFKNMTMTSKEIFNVIKSMNMELKVSMSYNINYDGTPMKYFKLSFEYR